MGKPEGRIESYLRQRAEAMGYLCWKFTSPGTNGGPDRLLIGHGKTFFVEAKAPGESARSQQKSVHRQMEEHGAVVFVADTKDAVDGVLRRMTPPELWLEPGSEPKKPAEARAVGCIVVRKGR